MASTMGAPPLLRSFLLGLCMVLLAFNFSSATEQTERIVAVVGNSECLDCAQQSIKNEEAFKGLHVAIQCKTGNGLHETKGVGLLDESGNFEAKLPSNVLRDDGELKDECFAQLRNASEVPCPDNYGPDQSKIVLKSKESGKHTYVVSAGKLSFSSVCSSELIHFLHHDKDYILHKFKRKIDQHLKEKIKHDLEFKDKIKKKIKEKIKHEFDHFHHHDLDLKYKVKDKIKEKIKEKIKHEIDFLHHHDFHHHDFHLKDKFKKPNLDHPDHPEFKLPPKPKFYKDPHFPPFKKDPIP